MAHPVTAKRLFDITAADVSYLCCYPNSCTLLDMVRWFLPEIGRRDKWLFSFRDSCWKQQCCLHWKVEILQDHHLHRCCRTRMKMSVHKLPKATLHHQQLFLSRSFFWHEFLCRIAHARSRSKPYSFFSFHQIFAFFVFILNSINAKSLFSS